MPDNTRERAKAIVNHYLLLDEALTDDIWDLLSAANWVSEDSDEDYAMVDDFIAVLVKEIVDEWDWDKIRDPFKKGGE